MIDPVSIIGHQLALTSSRRYARFSLPLAEGAVAVDTGLLELLVGLDRPRSGWLRIGDDPGELLRRLEEVVHRPGPLWLWLLPLTSWPRERAGLLAKPDQGPGVRGQPLSAGRLERGSPVPAHAMHLRNPRRSTPSAS